MIRKKMKKVIQWAALLICAVIFMGCARGESETLDRADHHPVPEYIISVETAELTDGEAGGVKKKPVLNTEEQMVENIISDASVEYTVPEITEGRYDIYLEIGKTKSMVGSTVFELTLNNQDSYVLPTKIVRAKKDDSDLYDKGLFLMAQNVTLKTGDEIKIIGKAGYTTVFGEDQIYCSIPAIGDLCLYQAGTSVAVGYGEGTLPKQETVDMSDPISGKTICWLGSSVTYGAKAEGYSMADSIEENHKATHCLKYTISGTTLADTDGSSYVARLKRDISPELPMDVLIVQLSTNDAKIENGLVLGTVSSGRKSGDFDVTTITGAMEEIIAYSQETWGCPVIFYTGTRYNSEMYGQMVEVLYQLQEKWQIGLIDLWNNQEMTNVIDTEPDRYRMFMADETHPTEKGYREWWTPVFEDYLKNCL